MNEEKRNELIASHEEYVRISVYNVLFTNDLVREYASYAMMKLNASPLDRYQVRHYRKRVQKTIDSYEKGLNVRAGEQAGIMDMYSANFSAEVDTQIHMFYINLKNAFDKSKSPHSDILAYCELARTLANYSVLQLNKRVQELVEIDPMFNSMDMSHLSLHLLSRELDCLMSSFNLEHPVHADTDECLSCFRNLKKLLVDVSLINKSINLE